MCVAERKSFSCVKNRQKKPFTDHPAFVFLPLSITDCCVIKVDSSPTAFDWQDPKIVQ